MAISAVNAIGVLGGTFDPIHNGHLRLAWEALSRLSLQEVRLYPCHVPPHRDTPNCRAEDRLHMAQLACANVPGLVVDDWEIQRHLPSYTVETLTHLREQIDSQTRLVFLMGMDAFCHFSRWHEWTRILELAHLWIAQRPGADAPAADSAEGELLLQHRVAPSELLRTPAGKLCVYDSTALDISATQLRRQIALGISPRFLLPDSVWDYIEQHDLYRERKAEPAND